MNLNDFFYFMSPGVHIPCDTGVNEPDSFENQFLTWSFRFPRGTQVSQAGVTVWHRARFR